MFKDEAEAFSSDELAIWINDFFATSKNSVVKVHFKKLLVFLLNSQSSSFRTQRTKLTDEIPVKLTNFEINCH